MERRAIEWLHDESLISDQEAEKSLAARPDPDLPAIAGAFDPHAIAREAADDLKRLYGDRLRTVLLFGSWARGDAHPESDIDLLVVLDRVEDVWREHDRVDDVLYRRSLDNNTVISAIIVSAADLQDPPTPALMRARIEGLAIA
ncbi:MAG: nucleotidyltransferase domain-containing protein [Chloroflexi bacterium]|nr:nucleotidyltransferase domain-containing protein [Chloroflexota bacterium]MBI2983785.1 nucleotidyltransferase domain-containing protein [Chloroflexota bacterium]